MDSYNLNSAHEASLTNENLIVNGLVKSFGSFKAVDHVSLEVEKGLVTLLIGANGSGKTTLINCISGLYKPNEGQVLYKGIDITGKEPHQIVEKGLVRTFQIPMSFQSLTVFENLLVSCRSNPGESPLWCFFKRKWLNQEKTAVERALKIMQLLKLDQLQDAPANTLSGGQLKLLEVGRALMTDAIMILMDEPVGSVSPTLAHEIFSHIVKVKNELGITFFIIEHRLDIAAQYVDYVYAMARGKLISKGKPEEVFNDAAVIESYLGA